LEELEKPSWKSYKCSDGLMTIFPAGKVAASQRGEGKSENAAGKKKGRKKKGTEGEKCGPRNIKSGQKTTTKKGEVDYEGRSWPDFRTKGQDHDKDSAEGGKGRL